MIGKTIGNYKIVDQLGAGGMGEVYRAHDSRLGRDVAMKVLPETFSSDPERLARFEREAKVLAGLSHPNVGSIFGIEESGGTTFLVLELVEGEDLAARLSRGPMAVEEVVEVALQIAEALEAAHEQGIIHRDLKPANIVLGPEGRAKVLDFGLAKALDTDAGASSHDLSHSPTVMASSPTVAGVILGTAAYMSPEQARGKVVDKRADVFAFGAVMWEMLTGRQLFSGETVSDTLAAVLRATPDFDELPAATPAVLRRLLGRCLEKDARRRLRDIGEARIALDDIRSGRAATTGETAPAAGKEARTGVAMVFGVVGWVVAAIFAMLFVVETRHEEVTTTAANAPLRKFSIALARDDASVSSGFSPAISPDGRYLVYLSENQLWLRDLTSPDAHPIAGTEGALRPFWSPDGNTIAFGLGSRIERIPREGGRATAVATFQGGMTLGAAATGSWSADGRIVVSTAMSGLYAMPSQGGEMTSLLDPTGEETDFHEVSALPDGKGWVFVVHDSHGIGNIDAMSPDGNRHALVRIEDSVNDPVWSPSGHILFHRSGNTAGVWALPFSLERLEATGEPFLVAAGGRNPSVSRDGTLVYSRGINTGRGQLTWYDRKGNKLGTVGSPLETGRPFPDLSSDGKQVLLAETFGESREIFVYDVDSGNRRRITFDDARDDMAFFHPNGTDILSYESGTYTTSIRPLDGSRSARVIENAVMADIARDGSTLVVARKTPNNWVWEIHVMPAAGSGESTPIISTGGVDWWPKLSPDNRYLAYVSDETGRDEVYITTFPNATTRWQVSTEGGEWPRWRSDGREMYYTNHGHITAVSIQVGTGLTLGTPHELFTAPSMNWTERWSDGFDVTADGERFIVVAPLHGESDTAPSIVVVQNWFEEFSKAR